MARDGGKADEGSNRILAVDWGEKRVGLALSDTRRVLASPAGFLIRRPGKRAPISRLVDKARELGASSFVLGLPLDGNGDETPRSAEVRRVAEELKKRTGMPVELVDERYTTAAARRAVRALGGRPEERPGDVDSLSATVLLQHVLSRGERHGD